MIRLFAVILLTATTSIYGHPAGGSNVDPDKLRAGLDQVDWKGIKNGGFAFITTTTDPTTGQSSVKVTNSLASDSKSSSGIGGSLPSSKSASRYSTTSDYSIQPVDSELTNDVQNKYDWLSSPATPSVDTKKESDKKYSTAGLNKEEEDRFNWLLNNIKPATPDDTQTKSTAYSSQPSSSSNIVQWRPLFNNKPLYNGATTTTGSDLATPTSTNPSSSSVYKYPTADSTNVKPTSSYDTYPTTSSSYGRKQTSPTLGSLSSQDVLYDDSVYEYPSKNPSTTTPSLYPSLTSSPVSPSSSGYHGSVDTEPSVGSNPYSVDTKIPTTTTPSRFSSGYPSTTTTNYDPYSFNTKPSTSLTADVQPNSKNPSTTTPSLYPSLTSSPVSPSSSGYHGSVDTEPSVGSNPYSVDTKIPTTTTPSRFSSGYPSTTTTNYDPYSFNTKPSTSLTADVQPNSKNPSTTTPSLYPSLTSSPVSPSSSGYHGSVDTEPSVGSNPYSVDTKIPTTTTPSRFSSGYPSTTTTNYDPYSFNTKPSTSLTADVQPNSKYSAGQTTNNYNSDPASSQKATPNKGAAPGTLVLTKNNIDLWFPESDGYADKVNPHTGTH